MGVKKKFNSKIKPYKVKGGKMWIHSDLCYGYGRLNEAAFVKSQLSHERFKAGFGNGRGLAALDLSQWAINRCGDISNKQASGKGSGRYRYPIKNDNATNCIPTQD